MSKVKELKETKPELPPMPPQQPEPVMLKISSQLIDAYLNIIDVIMVNDNRAESLKVHMINLVKEAQKRENEASDK